LRIEIWAKNPQVRVMADGVTAQMVRVYFLQGDLSELDVITLCQEVLVDPVAEAYCLNELYSPDNVDHYVDVTLHPGVTDPAAESLMNAARVLGIQGLQKVATGQRYLIYGETDLTQLATQVFSNPLIQYHTIDSPIQPPFITAKPVDDTVEIIPLKDVTDDQLIAISQERRLSLDLNEMRAIQAYFQQIQRDPTDAELEMLAQTWSEHCVHKTFKARIIYTGPAHGASPHSSPQTYEINGLLKTYIRAATDRVNKPWVRSAFVDNAGIIQFDENWDVAFKVETHNRPSALEPFGGANTGVGGVIRDVLGVSAKPIANTDILCFGMPDENNVPEGVLHPKRIAEGVVAGIEDYGNKMGIPTVNGAIHYHRGYTANPLVFCGCLGILPRGAHRTQPQPGDLIVVIGGRTGRDGLRGATFSSMEMDTSTSTLSGGAVQIGHPIHEKQVQEVVLRARDESLYTAITDCGAGGLSSAVGEMGAAIGATVQLNTVPLKYPGLRPWEIWLSEAQERMVLAVPPENLPRLQVICAGQDVEIVVIGIFEPTGRLILHYGDKLVGDVAMDFLHDGIPQRQLEAVWSAQEVTQAALPDVDLRQTLLGLLAMPTIRSKESVIRRYDHEVQGGTAIKPLVGVDNHAPADAAVIVPMHSPSLMHPAMTSDKTQNIRGLALSVGMCPQYTRYDPYAMAWAAVDEAIRNLVAVGADPEQVAILDNFSWGNTNLPDRLGELVRCSQGCYDAAMAYDVPFISGKDSLNNEYLGDDGERHAIPGTLVISALGMVPDVKNTVTMDLKRAGNKLYLIGETRNELGGSHFFDLYGVEGGIVPQPNSNALDTMKRLHYAIRSGWILACHDLSEGGLGVALAEMCIGGRLGATIVQAPMDDRVWLFSESGTRFIVEVLPEHQAAIEAQFENVHYLGEVTQTPILRYGEQFEVAIAELEQAWRGYKSDTSQVCTIESKPYAAPAVKTTKPRVLILHANGTNRDHDAALACKLAGGEPEIVHINQLLNGERSFSDYNMLVLPGGFSYGDDLGAGVLWALDLRQRFGANLQAFIDAGKPVLGICNGFQTLVKSGFLPGDKRDVTLTYNAQGQFECRWVYLMTNPNSPCLFTRGIDELLYVPVAHGEGRVMAKDEAALRRLTEQNLVTLTYVDANGNTAGYPFNPNGSVLNIAGLCNTAGNVLGLMPHPEDHIYPWQHPRFHRDERGFSGLRLFENGIRFA